MIAPTLPIPPRCRETAFTLVAATAIALGGCTGGGGSGSGGVQQAPDQVGPVVDAGPEFPIASSRLDAVVFTMRAGEPLPADAVRLIKSQSQSMPEPLRSSLTSRGFLGALMSDAALAELEKILVTKPISSTAPVKLPIPATLPPPPRPAPGEGPGTSIIGGTPAAEQTPAPEPVISATPVGSAVGDVSALSIRPGAAWVPLIDATPRVEPWALALGTSVASLKPGTLRCYARAWPAPAEPVPTAGMGAELRVQILPVVTGPLHEVQPDPLAPPPLSTDLAARGQVLSRQAFTTGLRSDTALVLIALPSAATSTGPGPQAESAPMLGQALLGSGPAPTPTSKSTGPRVLVLKAVVPGTYRLMLDRPAPAMPAVVPSR